METKNEVKAKKSGLRKLRGWLITLGVVAAVFLAGFLCCTFLS